MEAKTIFQYMQTIMLIQKKSMFPGRVPPLEDYTDLREDVYYMKMMEDIENAE